MSSHTPWKKEEELAWGRGASRGGSESKKAKSSEFWLPKGIVAMGWLERMEGMWRGEGAEEEVGGDLLLPRGGNARRMPPLWELPACP